VKKAITISSLIAKLTDENVDIKKTDQKIIVAGLDNAGKTAILKKFGGGLGISDLAKLTPTKGVERKVIKSKELFLYIMDMGGQEKYRKNYLEHVNQYFLELDLLIYVVDVQDSERFEDALSYFRDVLNVLTTLEENPHILIFLHKLDPDLKENPEIKLNIEYLKDKVQELFSGTSFEYELFLTSIYSMISREPQFSKYIKDLMSTNAVIDPTVRKVEGLGKILEDIMNAIIKLSESLSLQLTNMDERLLAIEAGGVKTIKETEPKRIQAQNREHKEENVRATVLTELKDLFSKKKKLNL